MKTLIFGMWKVCVWEAFRGVYQGEAILTQAPPKGIDVPSIMLEGIPFMVGSEGVEGEYTKYLFPPLIPRILDVVKG